MLFHQWILLNYFPSLKENSIFKYFNKESNSTTDSSKENETDVDSTLTNFNSKLIDEPSARKWVKYAAIAYCPKEVIDAWNCTLCEGNPKQIEKHYFLNSNYNTSGFIMADPSQKLILVSYKGTKNKLNWFMNLKTTYINLNLTKPYEEAKIHSGFFDMAQSLYASTKDLVTSMFSRYPDFNVIFTGHSMGGALATINSLQLVLDGVLKWEQLSLITYAQPRVGNFNFTKYMNSQNTVMTRVNKEGDPVPTIPPYPLYDHHGYNMFISVDNATIICLPTASGSNCTSQLTEMAFSSHFSFWDFQLDSHCVK